MPQVNPAELKLIASGRAAKAAARHGAIPWSADVPIAERLALCAMYGCLGYSGNFFLTLLPTYLKNHRHIDSKTAGLLTSLPFACGVVACLAGGAISDIVIRRWGPRWGRRSVGAVGLSARRRWRSRGALGHERPLLGLFLCLTFIGNDLAMGPAWAAAADIGGTPHRRALRRHEHDGQLHRGAWPPSLTGYLFESGYRTLPFVIFSGSYLLRDFLARG